MRFLPALTCLFLATLAACSSSTTDGPHDAAASDLHSDGGGSWFPTSRTYQHQLVTDAACAQIQVSMPGTNCVQNGSFQPDGSMMLLLTDIENVGVYTVDGARLSIHITTPSGEGPDFAFDLAADLETMVSTADHSTWVHIP
jgi:hypothetical protein